MEEKSQKDFEVVFFETASGKQPVREFIWGLTKEDKKEVGADIRTVQAGFPMGLPLVKKIDSGVWEIRSTIRDGICRVFFTVTGEKIVLLHAYLKKTQKIPPKELDIVKERLKELRNMQRQAK